MAIRTFPPLPGTVLRDEILKRRRISQADLARTMGVSPVIISHIVNGHAPITAAMAVRLGHATSTRPEHWLKLQREYDLFNAKRKLAATLKGLPRIRGERGKGILRQSPL